MEILILVVHILTAAAIIAFVLLQHGKGADMGAAFGSGASGSLFGASGSANFLSRTTAILAVVFFLTSLGLSFLSGQKGDHKGVMATQPAKQVPAESVPQPAAPADSSKSKDVPK